jgi:1,4-dihydroxy-2-naphthoate octaprenyltransferase
VYAAGMIFLLLGALIGTYFVFIRGITIALILGFAVVAIYFYSTSIVNAGLGELFVAIKGAMIVLGTFYVQTAFIDFAAIYVGVIVGILSATVLFLNSFPDYEADRSKGRRTLVIILGKSTGTNVFPIIVAAAYAMIIAGVFLGFAKVYSLTGLVSLPFAIKSIGLLRKSQSDVSMLEPAMGSAVTYSRLTGFVLAVSLIW